MAGQLLDRLGKTHALVLHQETDGAAMRAATKTMIKLFAGTDRERRGFLFMERTTGLVVLAHFTQRHARIDDLDDVHAQQQLVDEFFRDTAGHAAIVTAVLSFIATEKTRRNGAF